MSKISQYNFEEKEVCEKHACMCMGSQGVLATVYNSFYYYKTTQ